MVPGGVWLQTPGPTQKRNGSSVSVSRLMTFDLLNDTGRPPEGRMPHALEGRSGGGVLGATGARQRQRWGGGDPLKHTPFILHNFGFALGKFGKILTECEELQKLPCVLSPSSWKGWTSALNSESLFLFYLQVLTPPNPPCFHVMLSKPSSSAAPMTLQLPPPHEVALTLR